MTDAAREQLVEHGYEIEVAAQGDGWRSLRVAGFGLDVTLRDDDPDWAKLADADAHAERVFQVEHPEQAALVVAMRMHGATIKLPAEGDEKVRVKRPGGKTFEAVPFVSLPEVAREVLDAPGASGR